ncbi:aminoglycoside 3-N-acetyltransferase (plasmid) [Lactobacillus amylolyticus]|uniref:Uncharacterized protein n=1 Tax=Lactobacillus amylolyticus DSM 11664 TaxID=585524 RepID=D4YU83_9LACO|nr:hypothetical protein [Lactobacillus amylolyticus]EFG55229.1 hypothetical protein HMPREF0493_1094 [Lactobacillus amylolyticus DSM 11664]ARD07463.1 aminoglycoside 3-N-acetyltransferase [Lactobacillus amylolyticus]KRL18732.1 hypothetical protein FD39_GL000255 [Lactobacillus amylolyticus DSM 11664]QFY03808.1 aminoglycoside 3-N-acetyltransferase [Lactobacillus amylolyticus]QFY03981.1 aminoglycoside 3-N-acetyltransferase [Lactobacillus amylolyticus]
MINKFNYGIDKNGTTFEAKYPNEFKLLKLSKGIIKVINLRPLIDFAREWFDQEDHQFGNIISSQPYVRI